MKRVICISFCFFVLMFLVSCKSDIIDRTEIPKSINSNANVIFGDIEMVCSITYTSDNISCISIIQPKELKGITFSWSNDKYKVSCDELGYENTLAICPSSAFAQAITNVFNSIRNNGDLTLINSDEDMLTFSGVCDSGRFSISITKSSKSIRQINIDELNLKVDFLN